MGGWSIALASHYLATMREAEALNQMLERRVATREAEIKLNYAEMKRLDEARALEAERQRLMREIHDGIEASLVATASSIRHDSGFDQVTRALDEAITDLKLTVDSLEPVEGDLLSLFGNLRYRLERRLERVVPSSRMRLRAAGEC